MNKKIIDVSKHQGVIDWNKAKKHIDGAILRCGYGSNIASQDDKQFKRNADECTRLGIPFGVYIYSYAKTTAEAKSEAQHVLRVIKGYKLSYPVYYDLEEPGTEKGAVDRALVFAQIIKDAGYLVGMYANEYWFDTYLKSSLDAFTKWVARYSTVKPTVTGHFDIWQYSSKGSVEGINGYVDMNVVYRDLVSEITGKGSTSSASSSSTAEKKKSNDEIAKEVIDGKWGSGETRKKKLEAAGYNYSTIQALVNKKLNVSTVSYYPKYSGKSVSLSDALSAVGVDGSKANRKKIAAANGIKNYSGTSSQNTSMLNLLKQGKLKK